MKKAIIPIVIGVLVISFLVSVPLVNDLSAQNVAKQLTEIPLPDNTEIVESLSKAGKLVGNGNGMQYFGAMLIKSELTLDELSAYYSHISPDAVVKEQKTQKIEFLEHGKLSFKTNITDSGDYYVVYLFGSGITLFSELDIRGH